MIAPSPMNSGTNGILQAAFDRSIRDPKAFWAEAAAAIHWHKKWDKALDDISVRRFIAGSAAVSSTPAITRSTSM